MLYMSLKLKISDIPQYQHRSCEYSHKAAQRNKGDHLVLLFLKRKDCQERFAIQAVHLQDEAQMCAAVAYSQGLDLRALGLDIVLYRKVEVARLLLNFGIFIPLQAREFCLHWSICRVFACFGLTELAAYESLTLRHNPSHRQRVACLTKSSTKCWLISSSQRPFHYPSTRNSILFLYHVGLDA